MGNEMNTPIGNSTFFAEVQTYMDGEDVSSYVLNRPLLQIAMNTGWLKRVLEEALAILATKQDKIVANSAFNKNFGTTAGTVAEGNDPRLSNARQPLPHVHKFTELDFSGANGIPMLSNGSLSWYNIGNISVTWSSISGKPALFPSSIDIIEGLRVALDGKANTTHTQSISSITGLQAALDTKTATGHRHSITDIDELTNQLNLKANTKHYHLIEQINGLRDELNARASNLHPHHVADIVDANLITKRYSHVVKAEEAYKAGIFAFSLEDDSTVYQVTVNGLDLWETDFLQSGKMLYVKSKIGDRIIVYSNSASHAKVINVTIGETTTVAPTTTIATTTAEPTTTVGMTTTLAPTTTVETVEPTTTTATTTVAPTTTVEPTTTLEPTTTVEATTTTESTTTTTTE